MSLSVTLRPRHDREGRVEIHRELIGGSIPMVRVIAYSPRYVEASVGFTTAQARELCLCLLSVLSEADRASVALILADILSGSNGALGKNTDTDSHCRPKHEGGGDCRLSAGAHSDGDTFGLVAAIDHSNPFPFGFVGS